MHCDWKSVVSCALALLLLGGCAGPAAPTTAPTDASTPPETTESTHATDATEVTVPATEATQPIEPTPSTEATEPPAPPLPDPEDDALVRVMDYIPGIRQQLPYASVDNFTGQRIYDFADAYLRGHTVKKLKLVSEELAQQGLGLLIWDGFRPVSAQAKLWEICPDPNFVSHPVTGNRSHCRGTAVDLTLVDLKTGAPLKMPTGFDNFTPYADRDYSDCAPDAAANALLLENVMKKHGFKPYSAEWWHYTDTKEYPVDEIFSPTVPTLWNTYSEGSVTLWKKPEETAAITRIPAGKTVTLLGWDELFAKVSYAGKTGYVQACQILPTDGNWLSSRLDVVAPTDTYTHAQMLQDLQKLAQSYPEIAQLETAGYSELGKEIPVLRIGRENARYHVLLHGAIHGREHMTTWLLSAMAEYWLDHDLLSYGDVCWHILPMVNPDGVEISQTGTLNADQKKIYAWDKSANNTKDAEAFYAARWKANGLGVDLNRNFDAAWDVTFTRDQPSSQNHKGDKAFSAAESRMLRDYTLRYDFDITISYHAFGSLIYWAYGKRADVNSQSKSLAQAVEKITGYPLEDNNTISAGGYKDWAMDRLGIPSLTVEIGCCDAPLARRELDSIFARNLSVLPELARWLQR